MKYDTKFTFTFKDRKTYEFVWNGISMLDDDTSLAKCDPLDLSISVYFMYETYSKSVALCRLFGTRTASRALNRIY